MSHRWKTIFVQGFRHFMRLFVLMFVVWTSFGGRWRNFKLAHNSSRLVALMEGEWWGKIYAWNESFLSLFGESFRSSLKFMGIPWASTTMGFSNADPILVLSHIVSSRSVHVKLLLGLIVPLSLAAVFGKVFCSHLCPMRFVFEIGQLIRRGLLFLGVPMLNLRSKVRLGGWVLLGGLIATWIGTSVVWLFLLPYVSLTAGIFLAIAAGTSSALLFVPAGWLFLDVFFAPGFFCHNLCPQGFLLEMMGRFSFWRVRKAKEPECPTQCRSCEQICPYALSPREETHTPACDNCGMCVAVCPKRKLKRKFMLPVIAGMFLLLWTSVAGAHHNKGLPHYGYFKNYPQVPTQETIVIHGEWEMGSTIFNFQGYDRGKADTPNDVKFFVYLYHLPTDKNYEGPVSFDIRHDGKIVSTFTRDKVDEEMVYSTRETLPESGDYEMVAWIPNSKGGKKKVSLPFHIKLKNEGVSGWVLAAIGGPVLALFVLALLGRSRRGKSLHMKQKVAAFTILLASLCSPLSAEASLLGSQVPTSSVAVSGQPHCDPMDSDVTMRMVKTTEGKQVMVMSGLPRWIFIASIPLVVIVSFLALELVGERQRSTFRYNLIKNRKIYGWFRNRWFQVVPQLVNVILFFSVVGAGLVGSQYRNIAPIAVWTIWWGGLIFGVLLLGPVFCFTCPWDGLSNLVSRLRVAARVEPLSMNVKVPTWLQNTWPAIVLFVLLSWSELGLDLTTNPRGTAYLGLAMAACAIGAALVFPKKAFCEYFCPVGRITGIYSNFSPIELRARNPKVCQKCKTEDCLHGNERGYPCPTGISLKVLNNASYCTGCTECIKSCDKQNIALNLRPFAAGLDEIKAPRRDEAWFCLLLLALTLFHGFTMTTLWENHVPGSKSILKSMQLAWPMMPKWVDFTLGMALFLAIPVGVYWISCRVADRWVRNSGVSGGKLFLHYSLALVPVALFYHLAHNSMHVLMEGGHVIPLVSDPLGAGTNYLGTALWAVPHHWGASVLPYVQVALIMCGHLFGVIVAYRISRKLFSDKKMATKSLIPLTAVMTLLSVAGLWLMAMDMNMRIGRM
jgi:polyferredoxin